MQLPSLAFSRVFLPLAAALALVFTGCTDAPPASGATPSTPTKQDSTTAPPPKTVSATSQPGGAATQPAKTKTQAQAFAESQSRIAGAKKRLNASEAGKKILRSIESHGGLKAWFSQGAIRFTYDYRPVADAKKRRKSDQTVDVMSSRAYHRLEFPATGAFAFDGKQAWSKLEGDAKFPARFWALTPFYFVAMPYVLSDPGVKLKIVDHSAAAAGFDAADVIAVTFEAGTGDAPDDTYYLYLDPKTARVLGLRYTVTYAPFFAGKEKKRSDDKLIHYGDVKPVGPLHLPTSHRTFMFDVAKVKSPKKGAALSKKVTQATVSDAVYAAPFDEARLEMPPGAKVDGALTAK